MRVRPERGLPPVDSPVFGKKYSLRLRSYSLVYALSIAIHLLIFLLLIFFPLRVGTEGLLGKGSAISAGLVMEKDAKGVDLEKARLFEHPKKDIHDLLRPPETMETDSSWSVEMIETRKDESPDFEILGIGGRESQGFTESVPPASYRASFEGFQGSFNDYVGLLRRLGLDVVFVLDATGSMEWIIEETKAKMTRMMSLIKRLVPIAKVGIVVYRDRKSESSTFVTKAHPLTINVKELQSFLNGIEAKEGGDLEEAVEEGLRVAVHEMQWRQNSKKVIILVGDAPPHKADVPEAFEIVQAFRSQGGFVSAIDATHKANDETFSDFDSTAIMSEFTRIAEIGHGEATSLTLEGKVVKHLIVQVFGSRWEENLLEYIRYF